ncbi:hypothetical protein BJ741DRAFT_611546 [Chytriomyces cf. hyalinus JEL632]|nr:hypothetical protein BJ741DRAFT_611546 [Chytriomyces cf. hyalinus JEL632]
MATTMTAMTMTATMMTMTIMMMTSTETQTARMLFHLCLIKPCPRLLQVTIVFYWIAVPGCRCRFSQPKEAVCPTQCCLHW